MRTSRRLRGQPSEGQTRREVGNTDSQEALPALGFAREGLISQQVQTEVNGHKNNPPELPGFPVDSTAWRGACACACVYVCRFTP